MSKEFAEKNKNKKTPQEIKAEAQAKANSSPAPEKSAPKPTQNTTDTKFSQKATQTTKSNVVKPGLRKYDPLTNHSRIQEHQDEIKGYTPTKTSINPNSPDGIKAMYGVDVPKVSTSQEIPSLMSDDELINYYESLPNYNAAQRLFDKDKRNTYKEKQSLSQNYQAEINKRNRQKFYDAGLTDDDARWFLSNPDPYEYDAVSGERLNPGSHPEYDERIHRVVSKIFENGGEEQFREAFKDIDKELKSQEAKDNKFIANVNSVVMKPFANAINVGKSAGQFISGKPITKSQYTDWKDIRTATKEDNAENGRWGGKVANALYDTAMASGDILMALGLGNMFTGGGAFKGATETARKFANRISSATQGIGKAEDTIDSAVERDLTPGQIAGEAGLSGVITYLTSQLPFEAITSAMGERVTGKGLEYLANLGKKFVKTGLPEGLQEIAEDFGDNLVDLIIAKDKSELARNVAYLESQGKSKEDAVKEVGIQFIKDALYDGLIGFFSSGGLGVMGSEVNPEADVPALTEAIEEVANNPEIAQTNADVEESINSVANPEEEADLISNVENALAESETANPLNDEELLPLDLFENPDDAQNVNELLNNSPVDNAGEMGYGEDAKGDLSYDGTDELNAGRTDGRTQRTGEGYSETYDSEGQDARGNQRVFRQSVINDDIKTSYARAEADTQIFENVSDRLDEFSERLELARQSNKYGLMVSPKSPQEMIDSGALVFMSENGNSGALVTEDGDIEAVFHIKDGLRRTSYQTIITAMQNGGIKLDCYGADLVNNYNALGFEAVSMTPWNEAYAPDGWTYGEKDVYAMKLRDGITAEDVIAKLGVPEKDGGFHLQTNEELEALKNSAQNFTNPDTGYDEAMNYRDGLINALSNDNTLSNYQNILPTIEQPESTASFNFDNNATPQNPNNDLASIMDSYVNEQQGNQNIPQIDADEEWENRSRKAVKKNKDKVSVTQYARNTLYDLPSVKANKDVQQFLLNEEANGTLGGKIVHNEDSVREAKTMLEAAQEVDGNVDGVIKNLVDSEHTISDFGAKEQDELQLALDIKLKEASEKKDFSGIRDILYGVVLKERHIGQALQALAKYSHTASSVITKAESLIHGITESYQKKLTTKKRAEKNAKLAKALAQMGDDTKSNPNEKVPTTHEDIVGSVRNTLETEYSSVFDKFTDNDIEFIASMLEANTPVNAIQDELEHWFKHGEWYTLDESIEIKPETSKKLDKILAESGNKMADVKKETEPLTQSKMREQIRNTLTNEFSSISDNFTEEDIDFIINMFEENIPKWQIRDEIEHFVREGEWYTLDESIENAKPMSKEISKALDVAINGEPEAKPKTEKTVSQIEEEIRNRLDEEPSNIRKKFSDTDIKFLANRILRGESADVINDMINRKLTTGYFEISDEDLQFVVDAYDEINGGQLTSKEEYFKMQQVNARLAKYLGKGTLLERLNQWRYFAMLHAPSTHLKNTESNSVWSAVTMFKDMIAAAGEEVYSRTEKGKDMERTKSILTHKDGSLVKAGWKDFADWAWAEYARGGSKYNDRNEIKQAQQIGSKVESKLANFNSDLLENEDILAGRIKYTQALAGYLKANGKNESIFTSRDVNDRALLDRARNYALAEANKATFHEDNKLANWLTRASRSTQEGGLVGLNFVIESLIPFKKTTSNIGKQFLVEYNPAIQLPKAIYQTIAKDGDVSATIDSYAKAATGSGLIAMGYLLAKSGFLVARRDDDDKDDVLGKALNYAITWIDKKGKQHYVTIDELSPTAMLMCVGAELLESGFSGEALAGMGDSFIENTLLSGLDGLIKEIQNTTYDKEKHVPLTIAAKLLNTYFSQYIPTSFGKLARTIDPTQRNTNYTGLKGDKDTFAKYGKQLLNKLPGLSYLNEPKVNAYGEEIPNIGGNFASRLAYNFFSTFRYSKRERDEIQSKIAELDAFAQTLDGSARDEMEKQLTDLITKPESSFDGEKLTPKEYTELSKETGKAAVELFSTLVNADGFNQLEPEAQAKLMDDMGLFARALGKRNALGVETKSYESQFKTYENGADALVDEMVSKYLLAQGGIQSNSKQGKELLEKGNVTADDIAKVTGVSNEEKLATQQKIANELPTLDTTQIMSDNGDWVNAETAIPYLNSLGLDDATQGEILYNSGKRSQKEIDAFNDMGGYEGVKQYYDIKEYGETHGKTSVTKTETVEYLEGIGASADEINAWLSIWGWQPDYKGSTSNKSASNEIPTIEEPEEYDYSKWFD